jgi:hypothetical protein
MQECLEKTVNEAGTNKYMFYHIYQRMLEAVYNN